MCFKVAHESWEVANQVAQRRKRSRDGDRLKVYKCSECGKWHTTSQRSVDTANRKGRW